MVKGLMHKLMHKHMNGRKHVQIQGHTNRLMPDRIDTWTDIWMETWMDARTDT